MIAPMSMLERAEAAERAMTEELDRAVVKSTIYTSGDRDPRLPLPSRPPGKRVMMGHDPRLAPMPDKPTVMDFITHRFSGGSMNHMMQSARLAQKNGLPDKLVFACLVHDIGIAGFIRGDHGYWAAQLVEPYVDEEVSWAIRYHQALRFFADESVGYEYPKLYRELFGDDYVPDPYIQRDYRYARDHRWYMSARQICVNDLYAFDPTVKIELEEFTDVIGRNFRQPKEGLGFDASPSSHMWRTIMWPTKYL
jgi:HD domain-containing protein